MTICRIFSIIDSTYSFTILYLNSNTVYRDASTKNGIGAI